MEDLDVHKSKRTKKELYKNEREDIIKTLNDMFNINSKNNIICPDNFTDEQKGQIDELSKDVKLYFKCGSWAYYNGEIKNTHMSLIKSIYKDMGYDVISTQKRIEFNNEMKYKAVYVVGKKLI